MKTLSVIPSRIDGEESPSHVRGGSLAALGMTLAMFIASAANACPVCFGDPSAPSAKGMNNAIWFLLAMVGFIQIAFGALFVTFWRRARALRRRRESFQVLDGGVR